MNEVVWVTDDEAWVAARRTLLSGSSGRRFGPNFDGATRTCHFERFSGLEHSI